MISATAGVAIGVIGTGTGLLLGWLAHRAITVAMLARFMPWSIDHVRAEELKDILAAAAVAGLGEMLGVDEIKEKR